MTTRKEHQCRKCGNQIEKGDSAILVYYFNTTDGRMERGRHYAHTGCSPELIPDKEEQATEEENAARKLEEIGEYAAALTMWKRVYELTKKQEHLERCKACSVLAKRRKQ